MAFKLKCVTILSDIENYRMSAIQFNLLVLINNAFESKKQKITWNWEAVIDQKNASSLFVCSASQQFMKQFDLTKNATIRCNRKFSFLSFFFAQINLFLFVLFFRRIEQYASMDK